MRSMLLENVKKVDCYTMTESMANLSPTVPQKVEFVSNKLRYFAEISQQSVKVRACFCLTDYSKMQKQRDKLKDEVLNKGNQDFIWKLPRFQKS